MDHLDALFPPAPQALDRLRKACLTVQSRLEEAALLDGPSTANTRIAVRMAWEMHTYKAKKVDVSVHTKWPSPQGGDRSSHQRVQRAATLSRIDAANESVQHAGSALLRALSQGGAWRRLSFLPKMAVEITPQDAQVAFGRLSIRTLDLHQPSAALAARALLLPMPTETDGGRLYRVSWQVSYYDPGSGDTHAALMAAHPAHALALFGALHDHRVFHHGATSHASVLLETSKNAWEGLCGPRAGGWSPEDAPTRAVQPF